MAAGESLVHLVVRIGEMLAYQSYNVKTGWLIDSSGPNG